MVEDSSEQKHVVQNGKAGGKLKATAPKEKVEPVVQKPAAPSPFAEPTDTTPPALITTPEPKAKDESPKGDDEPEPTALEKKRTRAYALLSDWPEDRERTAQTLAAAIASSEPMAARFIQQYDVENGLATTSQN